MSLTTELQRIATAKKKTLNQAYRMILNDVANQMITSSPFDTGAFRSNWMSSANFADLSYDKTETSVTTSFGRLTATLSSLTTNDSFYFTNSLPYAEKLEEGWSDFAPMGIVNVAINDFHSIVEKRVNQLKR